ncbi:hypothetical protein T440DRAFT_212182 [Plenodomus tracheiphilus IPT5]|uniref:Heterokaryon incompatibility domain-containing protein n=1 Tax=Plenodomus tracheiphilus IPT5 TaxID=1408161 RepID=A0A6A7AY44_9PLEO|nr:hypothetical protein T440DRAFT_212182 [Plenodomus tracheiphilus IPT5]
MRDGPSRQQLLRDKVYGVLVLLANQEETNSICVDYEKSVAEVYADTVLATIELYSCRNPLHHVYHGLVYRPDGSFTSWTPRWDVDNPVPKMTPFPFNACRDRPVKSVDNTNISSQYLRLSGMYYSEVTHTLARMDEDNFANKDNPLLEMYDMITERPGTESLRKLARTSTVGESLDLEILADVLLAFRENSDRGKDMMNRGLWYLLARVTCNHRRFFTHKGTFGLGPECMRTGDIVVVLFGGETPYILRPHGDEYYFMGQAYVDEIMQGELVYAMDASEVEEQEFVLV